MRYLLFLVFLAANVGFAQEVQEAYENPVDGKTYIADWKTYESEGGAVPEDGRVTIVGVRLLSAQNDFERNTTAEELAKLTKYIQSLLLSAVSTSGEGGEVLLQVKLNKGAKPDFQMSYQGDLTNEVLEKFYSSLSRVELMAKVSTVTLQIHYAVKNA